MAVSKASLRGLRMKARLDKMREAAQGNGVRVSPANDTMRRLLRHPSAGGFGAEGSAEWPDDRFTKRRIADGDVTVEVNHEGDHQQGRHSRRRHEDNAA
jgi:hypothetical protein